MYGGTLLNAFGLLLQLIDAKYAICEISREDRAKRQLPSYHGDYMDYYGNGYGYQWIRFAVALAGFLAIVLCCIIPCICAIGIWLSGWFGLRKSQDNKSSDQEKYNAPPPMQPTVVPVASTWYPPPPVQPVLLQTNRQSAQDNVIPGGHSDEYVYESRRSNSYYDKQPFRYLSNQRTSRI